MPLIVGPCPGSITLATEVIVARPEEPTSLRARTLPSALPFGAPKVSLFFGKVPGVVNVYRAFVFDGMHLIKNVIKRWIELLKGGLVPKKPVWGENSRVTLARRDALLADWHKQVEKHRAFTLSKPQQNEVDQRWRELPCPPKLMVFSNTLAP